SMSFSLSSTSRMGRSLIWRSNPSGGGCRSSSAREGWTARSSVVRSGRRIACLFHGPWQGDVQGGTMVDLAFRPDAPAVAMDDAVDRGEADARALELIISMQTLEHAEQLVRVAGIEAGAVVLDANDDLAPLARGRVHFDHRFVASRGELDGVTEQ